MISERDCRVSDGKGLSKIFNEHFLNITKTLDPKPSVIFTTTSLLEIIETFQSHPSHSKAGVRPSLNKIFSLGKEKCEMKLDSLRDNEVRKVILNMAEKRPS